MTVVANGITPNKHQAISGHHGDCITLTILRRVHCVLQPLNKIPKRRREVRNPSVSSLLSELFWKFTELVIRIVYYILQCIKIET